MNIRTFNALAEPSRLQIVELLKGGPLTVGEIAEQLQIRQPQVSKHLKVLLEAGFVEVEAAANRRNYSLRTAPFEELDAWLEDFRSVWEERFDKLDHYLLQLQGKEAEVYKKK